LNYQVGEVVLEIVEGDITTMDTQAITNAANNHLWMGSGVAGAIKAAGRFGIEEEAISRGPIEVGEAVATGAGRLPFQYVIHGAVMGQDLRTDAELVAKTTRSCLELAEQLGLGSIALPAFGTGVGGFPLDECAGIMLNAAGQFAQKPPKAVRRIVFCLFGNAAYEEFATAAQEAFGSSDG